MREPTLAGRLLVATPMLVDSNFRRSVVFLLEDDDTEGSFGVIVNRPSELPVAEVLEGWGDYATDPAHMFEGGPVGVGSGLALGLSDVTDDPPGWRPLDGAEETTAVRSRLGTVDLDAPPEVLGAALRGLRVFAGYSGWGEGQLRAEIEEGAWYVLPATAGDVFSAEPEGLWPAVLRRQGGDLALLATLPDDPTLN